MPVPQSDARTAAPRTLLRDVVYAKMVAAIEDGTLVPGERLNDDELTAWLGVSRTPVREAIARLVTEGFVEMAANRYTKVSSLSSSEYGYASDFLAGLHQMALDRADTVDAAVRTDAAAQAKRTAGGLKQQELAAYRDLLDAYGVLTTGLANPLFTDAERSARGRAKFHAASPDVTIDWTAAAEQAAALAKL
jgi:DNA-binding GntR family transcriptional regulator